jgi:hypothetical protein
VAVDDQPDQPIPVTVPLALEGGQQLLYLGVGQAEILDRLAITGRQSNLRRLSLQAVEGAHMRTAKANRRAHP